MDTIQIKVSFNPSLNANNIIKPEVSIVPFNVQTANLTAEFQNKNFEELILIISQYINEGKLREISKGEGIWIYEFKT